MTAYYQIEPDIYALYGLHSSSPIPEGVNFHAGRLITTTLPSPLSFYVGHPPGQHPGHFLANEIPVISSLFLQVIEEAGIGNIQIFPAHLYNRKTGQEWTDYYALNVIGVVDAADLSASTYDTIMPGNDSVPPLLEFETLIFSRTRTMDLGMFRIPQNRTMLFVHGRIIELLKKRRPAEGWQVTAFEVPVQ